MNHDLQSFGILQVLLHFILAFLWFVHRLVAGILISVNQDGHDMYNDRQHMETNNTEMNTLLHIIISFPPFGNRPFGLYITAMWNNAIWNDAHSNQVTHSNKRHVSRPRSGSIFS